MNGHLVQISPELIDRLADEDVVDEIIAADGLDIGKAWMALHWVLTDGGMPGMGAVMGGHELAVRDIECGVPEFLTPDEVAEQARELEKITDQKIRSIFDVDEMVGDGVWPTNPDLDELIELASRVRAFYREAAAKGHGMLQFRS